MADNVESIERIEQEQRSQREKVRRRDRLDPFSIPDREFRGRYRFTKENVQKLINILTPHLLTEEQKSKHDNKGLPFSVAQIVCCGLDYLAGGYFQRVAGVCNGSSKSSAQNMVYRYRGIHFRSINTLTSSLLNKTYIFAQKNKKYQFFQGFSTHF